MKGQMSQMDDVGSGKFDICPKGWHIFRIIEVADGESKNKDPMISLTLEIKGGEHKGGKVWDRIILSGNPLSPGWKIRWRAKQFLKSINEPHHGDSFPWDSSRWKFQECKGLVDHEEQTTGKYAGQMKAVIKEYAAIEGSGNGSNPLEEDPEIPF